MVIMGDTCRALPTTEDTLACFGGIVNAISVDLNFSSNDVISMCTLAAHTEEEMSACGIPALMAMHSVSGVSPAEIAYACTDVATSTHMGACIEKYTTAEKSSGTIAEPHL